jgi:hypothetical protein
MKRGRDFEDDDLLEQLYADISTRVSKSILYACRLHDSKIECIVHEVNISLFNELLRGIADRDVIERCVCVYKRGLLE